MDQVDEAGLSRYYARSYRADAKFAELGPTSRSIYQQRGRALADLALAHLDRAPARVFEVGAGYGFNLAEFLSRFPGIAAVTDEVSSIASAHHAPQIARGDLADGGNDVVILSHVLEHFSDPVALLRRAAASLNPGGVVVIEVPNDVDGIIRYNGPDEPHLLFFELGTLESVLRQACLQVLDIYGAGPPNVRDTLALRAKRLVRDILNAFPPTNALFQRRASARISGDPAFGLRNPDGLFLRAVVRPG